MRLLKGIILFVLMAIQFVVIGQHDETRAGSYLIRNYSSKEHGGNAQIFDVTQDGRGLMYFGNQKGVLEYDGVSWNTIYVGEDEKKVMCVFRDREGKVLIGADGDFGRLEADSTGQITFSSWLNSSGVDSIGIVLRIVETEDELILRAGNSIVVLENNKLKFRIETETQPMAIAQIDDRIFVGQSEKGLYELKNGELTLVPKGEFFADKLIINILKLNDKVIVVTSSKGLFELALNGQITPLKKLENYKVLSAYSDENSLFLGTYGHGVLVLNRDFQIISEVGLEKGIADASVKCQYLDREGNFWIGTNIGISKISLNEPVLSYSKETGLNSGVESIGRFKDKLHFATQNGVYVFENRKIHKIEGIEKDCYGVRTFVFNSDTLMFVAGLSDVMTVDVKGKVTIIEKGGPYDFLRSPLNPNEVIVLHYDGISKLRYKNGIFEEVNYLTEIGNSAPFNFIIDEDGTIWVGTLNSYSYGVYKGHVNMFEQENPVFEHFGQEEGLPKGASYLFKHEGVLYIATDGGLYEFINNQFTLSNKFGFDFSDNQHGLHRINSDPEGNIWMIIFDLENNYQYGFSKKTPEGYIWNSLPFKRYSNEIVHSIYHDLDGITWLGGPAGLLRYDRSSKLAYNDPFSVHIRSVKFGDELLYGGTTYAKEQLSIKLNYSSNKALGFEFSSTSFIDEQNNLYSYWMEGQDDEWSEWSNRTMKEYNLSAGNYVFHVKTKNIYGNISAETTFQITILPPWYQTVWAYLLYVVLLLALVYGVIRLSLYRVRQKNIQLERVVEERTQEVVVQKVEAEKQRDEAEKQKKIADHQKELVEEKNREIVDSINYAKRIQEAIMPSAAALEEALKDVFLLYMPKDVVAGDFFWMEKIEDVVYYAAADCTGHGVPGAMVSVVCSNALTKALLEDGIRETGKLLDRTREIVIERLARSGEEVKDGMDISLCALNTKTNELEWSGANNPLWILRKDASEMEELKADKQPIGLFERATPFTTHHLSVEAGDTIYIFTDGYQDQFGGEKGKKFKPSAVKQLLVENASKSLLDQREVLHSTIVEWMIEVEQVDDICIIGVRI